MNALDKVVVSDTLTADRTAPWHNARILARADAHEAIAALKRGPGRDILVFGSHVLWNDLLDGGLVDEVHLMIGAVVLGDGTPAFRIVPHASLRLAEERTFDGSDNVLVRYDVRREAGGP
jgi:dihydrofolate reductase